MRPSSSETILFDRGLKEEKEYWLERLGNGLDGARLPADHLRDESGSPAKQHFDVTLPVELREQLGRISRGSSFLAYAALHAAVKLVIARYARSELVVVGSPVLRKGGQQACNVVPVVDALGADQTFRDVLLQVRQTLLDAYARQRYPFGRLVRDLGLEINVPIINVNTPQTLADDPQFQDRFPWIPVERLGAEQQPSPIKFLDVDVPVPTKAPTVGQHSEEILREVLGYDDERIAALRAAGTLG